MPSSLVAAPPLVVASTVLLLGFVALSAVDGLYLHLWKLRLHTRPASWREHGWHTARAVLFAPILALVFAAPTAGAGFLAGVALLAIDQVVELLDVLDERDSRAGLGGLSSFEYAVHATLVTLRAGAVALALAARPAEAWSLAAPSTLGAYPDGVGTIVGGLIPGAIAVAVLHVWLAWRYRPIAAPGALPA